MKQRRLLRTTEAVPVGRALHMEARVLSVWSSDGEQPPNEIPELSPDDVVQNLDAPALANALALLRLGHNAETLVVRRQRCSSARCTPWLLRRSRLYCKLCRERPVTTMGRNGWPGTTGEMDDEDASRDKSHMCLS